MFTWNGLSKTKRMVEDMESYVFSATWHTGRNFQVLAEIAEVNYVLKRIENEPNSLDVQEMEKLSNLRKRWSAAKGKLPTNPWASPLRILAASNRVFRSY
jgi:hypothetical protein